MTGTRATEYRVDDQGNINLYIRGEMAHINSYSDVRNVPARLRAPVLAALHEALRLGAAHGACDRQRHLLQMVRGVKVPGCATFHPEGYSWPRPKPVTAAVITRVGDEEVVAVSRLPSLDMAAEVAFAMDRAFGVGGGIQEEAPRESEASA